MHKPVPARITMALDARGLEGPDVDRWCGTVEGSDSDVDRWELALATPTPCQITRLSILTRFPAGFFYEPIPPGPHGGGIICWRDKRGCQTIIPDLITDDGVLLYEGKPRTLPEHVQGELFGTAGVGRVPARRPAPRRPRPPAPAPPELEVSRTSRMPDHLRAELDARLGRDGAVRAADRRRPG